MFNYKLIVKYHEKGNNHKQIAILCGCSRNTVSKILLKVEKLHLNYSDIVNLNDKELLCLLYQKRTERKEDYLIPDFKWEQFQMVKHQSSIRLCYRRYCRRARLRNLKAYTWSRYLTLYHEYLNPPKAKDMDKVRKKLMAYNFLLMQFSYQNGRGYLKIKEDKEEWLKSLSLEEKNILDDDSSQ